jgi:hypothetical protein
MALLRPSARSEIHHTRAAPRHNMSHAAFTVIAPVRGRIRTMPLQASLPPIEGFYLGIRTWISVRGIPLCSGHILSVPQGRSTCDRNDLSNTRRGRCSGNSACADRRTTTGRNTIALSAAGLLQRFCCACCGGGQRERRTHQDVAKPERLGNADSGFSP